MFALVAAIDFIADAHPGRKRRERPREEKTRVQDGVLHRASAANSRGGLAGEGRPIWPTLTVSFF